MKDASERFLEKCIPEPNSGCWIWTGFAAPYGRFKYKGKQHSAHRVSYEMFKAEIPDGAFVCHRCDNPLCVNPDHLWVGTAKDNSRDRNAKGRGKNYVNPGVAVIRKLSADARRFIVASSLKGVELAAMFGVSSAAITYIRRRARCV